jgi:hypothetical protein
MACSGVAVVGNLVTENWRIWKLRCGAYATFGRLARRGLRVSGTCPLCKEEDEDEQHMLWRCPGTMVARHEGAALCAELLASLGEPDLLGLLATAPTPTKQLLLIPASWTTGGKKGAQRAAALASGLRAIVCKVLHSRWQSMEQAGIPNVTLEGLLAQKQKVVARRPVWPSGWKLGDTVQLPAAPAIASLPAWQSVLLTWVRGKPAWEPDTEGDGRAPPGTPWLMVLLMFEMDTSVEVPPSKGFLERFSGARHAPWSSKAYSLSTVLHNWGLSDGRQHCYAWEGVQHPP